MITTRFLIWLLFIFVVFWIIVELGYDVLFIILSVQIILPIISLSILAISVRHVKIEIKSENSAVERKNKSSIEVEILNNGRYMFPFVAISGVWQNSDGTKTVSRNVISLKSKGNSRSSFVLFCRHCGNHTFSLIRVTARDHFGFFYLPFNKRNYGSSKSLIINVVPRWQPADVIGFDSANWFLNANINSIEVSPEIDILANLRDYQPGDSIKRIHWKISARLQKIMTKEFEDPADRFVAFSFDPQNPTSIGRSAENLDILLETAATAMKAFLDCNHQIKWLDENSGQQSSSLYRIDQFDMLRMNISQYSWHKVNWSQYLSISLDHRKAELLVLISWNLDETIKEWIRGFLMTDGHLMFLWLRNSDLVIGSNEELEWEKLITSGLQGYIIKTAVES